MSDYPPGARNDRNAPYNQREILCPQCKGSGLITKGKWVHDEPSETMVTCPLCDGWGYVDEGDPDVQDILRDIHDINSD